MTFFYQFSSDKSKVANFSTAHPATNTSKLKNCHFKQPAPHYFILDGKFILFNPRTQSQPYYS